MGYELLFREGPEDSRFTSDAESATCATIDTLNVIGFDATCDGRLAFINCTHQMLLRENLLLLPADKVVVEIQETVLADENIIEACKDLKHRGYRLALDNCEPNDKREALAPYLDFVKVDVQRYSSEQSRPIAARFAGRQCRMLAQRVETRLQLINAEKDGFTVFQGYFFRRPERMRARHIPDSQVDHLRLLQVISAPEPDLKLVEELIKHNPSLCYRLLRYLNSPLLGVACPIKSVRHGMDLLGEKELVRWIRMATTLAMGQDKCSDLVLSSLVRARFCELIAPKVDHTTSDLFLMGMLSLMDAILEVPMGVIVEGLAFNADTKAELLGAKAGDDTPLSQVYSLMLAREAGDWEQVTAKAKLLNLSLPFVNRSYHEAMAWANQMTNFSAGGPQSPPAGRAAQKGN